MSAPAAGVAPVGAPVRPAEGDWVDILPLITETAAGMSPGQQIESRFFNMHRSLNALQIMGGTMDPDPSLTCPLPHPSALVTSIPELTSAPLTHAEELSVIEALLSLESATFTGTPTSTALHCCLYTLSPPPASALALPVYLTGLRVSSRLTQGLVSTAALTEDSEYPGILGSFDVAADVSAEDAAAQLVTKADEVKALAADSSSDDASILLAIEAHLRLRALYLLLLWTSVASLTPPSTPSPAHAPFSGTLTAPAGGVASLPVLLPLARAAAQAARRFLAAGDTAAGDTAADAPPLRAPGARGFRSEPLPPLLPGHGAPATVDSRSRPRDTAAAAEDARLADVSEAADVVYPDEVAARLPSSIGASPARCVFPALTAVLTEPGRAPKPVTFPSARVALRRLAEAAEDIADVADALMKVLPFAIPAPAQTFVSALALVSLSPLPHTVSVAAAPGSTSSLGMVSLPERARLVFSAFARRGAGPVPRSVLAVVLGSELSLLGLGQARHFTAAHARGVCPSLCGWVEAPVEAESVTDTSLPAAAAKAVAGLYASAAEGLHGGSNVIASASKSGEGGAAAAAAASEGKSGKTNKRFAANNNASAVASAAASSTKTTVFRTRVVVDHMTSVFTSLLRSGVESDVNRPAVLAGLLPQIGTVQGEASAIDSAMTQELAQAGLPAAARGSVPVTALGSLPYSHGMFSWLFDVAASAVTEHTLASLRLRLFSPLELPLVLYVLGSIRGNLQQNSAMRQHAALVHGNVGTGPMSAPNLFTPPCGLGLVPGSSGSTGAAGKKKGKSAASDSAILPLSRADLACIPPVAVTGGVRAPRSARYPPRTVQQHAAAVVTPAPATLAAFVSSPVQMHRDIAVAVGHALSAILFALRRAGAAIPLLPQATLDIPAEVSTARDPPLRSDDLLEVWLYQRFGHYLSILHPQVPTVTALRSELAAAAAAPATAAVTGASAAVKVALRAIATLLEVYPASGTGLLGEMQAEALRWKAVLEACQKGALLEAIKLSSEAQKAASSPEAGAAKAQSAKVVFEYSLDLVFPVIKVIRT